MNKRNVMQIINDYIKTDSDVELFEFISLLIRHFNKLYEELKYIIFKKVILYLKENNHLKILSNIVTDGNYNLIVYDILLMTNKKDNYKKRLDRMELEKMPEHIFITLYNLYLDKDNKYHMYKLNGKLLL